MTYCLGISVNEGLVFISDSRTNAGVDQINTFSKMHVFAQDRRFLVLLSAGNLATTQGVISHLGRDIKQNPSENLYTQETVRDAANYVGEISRVEQQRYLQENEEKTGVREATFLLGGQIEGEEPRLLMIYPEGNSIRATDETCFLQLGETKYGKPILDRILEKTTSVGRALMCGLVSMDSTMKSSALVGPPIEYTIYLRDTYCEAIQHTLDQNDEYLVQLRQAWSEHIKKAFPSLPLAPGLSSLKTFYRGNVLKLKQKHQKQPK